MFPLLWSVLMTNTGTPFSPAIQVHCADGKHSSNCFSRWRWCSPSPSAKNFPLLLAQQFYFIRFHFYYKYSQLKIIQVTGCFIMNKTKPQAKQSIALQLLLACLRCTCVMYSKLKNYPKLSNLRTLLTVPIPGTGTNVVIFNYTKIVILKKHLLVQMELPILHKMIVASFFVKIKKWFLGFIWPK